VNVLIRPIELDYGPRPQFESFHDRQQRWAIIVAHRRAGKTVATINDVVKRAVEERKPDGRYAFLAPFYNQVKDIAWSYLKHYAAPIIAEPPREAELSVLLKGGQRIRLYGADNPDRLRGLFLDGVVLDEFADMSSALWSEVVRPALSDRRGWGVFIGTPKGKNAFYDQWQDALKNPQEWYSLMLKASETGIIPEHELIEMRSQMGEDRYNQELECSFEAAIRGAFYADELRAMMAEDRIRSLDIDPAVRVHTAWDLGISDSTAIWFIQCVGRERRLVDYYESSGVGLDHYAQVLHDKRIEHKWKYGEHFFPHDIAVREFTSGKSRLAALAALGIEAVIVPESNVLDGINVTRRLLGRSFIDPNRCERGLEALRQYRREYDERLKDWKANPLHDWSSHGADALRTFACGFEEPQNVKRAGDRHKRPPPSGASHWSA
jgi:phage terminase large subunit